MRLRGNCVTAATGVFVGVLLWIAAAPVAAQQIPLPKDLSFEETKPLGHVPFSHKFHVTEKKVGCQECHTKIFQMKKGAASPDMTMAKMNEGQFCGACHNGNKAFSTKDAKFCFRCHAKK